MDYNVILVVVFFTILVSLQYSLNKIVQELKEIKRILINIKAKDL